MFERYHLNSKPFEVSLLNYEMAGRKKEWNFLIGRLESAFKGNECKFIVIQGTYGLGKTYTVERLYRLFCEGEKQLFSNVFMVRTTLAERPIRAHPGEPAKAKFGLDFVTRIFKQIDFQQLKEIVSKAKPKLSDGSLKISETGSKIFAKIEEGERVAYSVLTGTETSGSELKAAGLRTVKDSQVALDLLFDFQGILKAADYNNFLIILDEFEYIPTLSTSRVTVVLDTFRSIFDQYGISESRESNKLAKIVFLFAISPGGWQRIKDLESSAIKRTGGGGLAPFMDRINPIDIITLSPLSPKEIRELIKNRLEKHRIVDEKVPDSLYPFAKESVDFVAEISQGVPRRALQLCGILLEDSAEKSKAKITLKQAKKVLGDLGLYTEPKIEVKPTVKAS